MKSKLLTLIAVAVFVCGAIIFVSANRKRPTKPQPFVVTYRAVKVQPGQQPVVTGLVVRAVNADGQAKYMKLTAGAEADIRFVDALASYRLAGTHLEYIESSESFLVAHSHARSASWLTSSEQFVREDSVLGLKVYVWHKEESDGWVERAYSPQTGITPLLEIDHFSDVETRLEAISIQFRELSLEEIAPPDLPVKFNRAEALEQAFRSGDESAKQWADAFAGRMRATREMLRAQGRAE